MRKTQRGLKYKWTPNKDDITKLDELDTQNEVLLQKNQLGLFQLKSACNYFTANQLWKFSKKIKIYETLCVISYMCQNLLVSLRDANLEDIDCAHHRITMTTYTQCYHRNVPCSRYYTFDQQISAIFSFHT